MRDQLATVEWRDQLAYAALWPVVMLLLCVPASNASAEHAFSNAGFVSSDREQL